MDPYSQHSDDLSELERRLSAWQPASAGLDSDAMLFAAGRATAQPRPLRVFWPALTVGTTLLAVVLGVWLFAERSERLALVQQLRQQMPPKVSPPSPVVPAESPIVDEPSPDSYLASHRALKQGLDNWLDRTLVRVETPVPPLSNPPILQVGQRDILLDP